MSVSVRPSVRPSACLSTVPNQAGQSRFLLLGPAVPPGTPLVPNLFVVAASVFCLEEQLAHTRRQDAHAVALLTSAVEIDYFIYGYAGREVRDSPPRDERHTQRVKKVQNGFLCACALTFVPILVRNSRI